LPLDADFNIINPTIPDISEATRIESFARSIISESVKASVQIKIDIVKPMPAMKPVPIT